MVGPSIVGATRNDTFDTLFEVFSCVNEQPGRLVWYQGTLAALAGFGSFLLAAASTAAGRIGFLVLKAFMGAKMTDVMANAAFYFKVNLPGWCPGFLRDLLLREAQLLDLPYIYMPTEYTAIGWSVDVASVLVGVVVYIVVLMVLCYGLSVWYTGNTLIYAVLAQKKDEKNVLELPEDDEDLIEPVVPPPEPPKPPTVEEKPPAEPDKPAESKPKETEAPAG